MNVRWTTPQAPDVAAALRSEDASSVLADAYRLLREIARRPTVPAPDATQEETAAEHRPVTVTGEEAA